MSLGYLFVINARAREARAELKVKAEHARRCLGQSIRRAVERLAKRETSK